MSKKILINDDVVKLMHTKSARQLMLSLTKMFNLKYIHTIFHYHTIELLEDSEDDNIERQRIYDILKAQK